MINILVVEDSQDKLKRISQSLMEVEGIALENISHAQNAQDAKRLLSQNFYDLLILDIAIPPRFDMEVEADGGLKLVDELMERDQYRVPTHVVGLTAFPEIFSQASQRFSRVLLTMVFYDPSTDEWIEPLQARMRHIWAAKRDQESAVETHQTHLAIVCALHTPELSSVIANGWHWEQKTLKNDHTIYYRAELRDGARVRVVYAAAAARVGMTATAVLVMKMIAAFRPEFIAMVGITAGVKEKTRFGDIIVADPSWDWGSGKWETKNGELCFLPAPHQLPLAASLRDRLRAMSLDATVLSRIRTSWPADAPDHELSMHLGPQASGASVLTDGTTVNMILSQHRNLLGVEMETYALFAAADEAPEPRPTVFSMKSVVDFGDGNKNDQYQKYSAFTSTHALKYFVEQYL
jgi:nucleoside phosphorylase/CheY-like chemotaxis protein